MLAVGFALSYHVLNMYYHRLVCHNLPPREVIVSSFIPVAAVSTAGGALLRLATAAELHVRRYYESLPDADKNDACKCCGCKLVAGSVEGLGFRGPSHGLGAGCSSPHAIRSDVMPL